MNASQLEDAVQMSGRASGGGKARAKVVNSQGPVWQDVSAEQGVGVRGRHRCRTKPEARKGQGQTHWEGFTFAVKETRDL